MFSVTLQMRACNYQGIQALDLRRRIGLPDGVRLVVVCSRNNLVLQDCRTTRQVSEEFARQHFYPQDIQPIVLVPVEYFQAQELRLTSNFNTSGEVRLGTVSQERLEELFVRFKTDRYDA